jgi:hypothetical protein
MEPSMETVPKPDELLALHGVTTEMFHTLRRWFGVPPVVALDLREVDSAVTELGDPVMIAAMAMRKLQALNLLSMPGVRTTTDVVVTIVQDLDRALVQAPSMRLGLAASTTDWDAAFAALEDDDAPRSFPDIADVAAEDPETSRFRALHARLHDAVMAVLRATDNEIRYLE